MKKTAKKAIKDAVQKEKLNGRVIDNLDVLECLPDIFDCLRINGNYVARCLREAGENDPKNFFENLLEKFGFEVIKSSRIQSRLEATEREPLIRDNFIVVDDNQLIKSIDKIADILSKKEDEAKKNSRNSANKNNSYVTRIDELEQQKAKLMTEYDYIMSTVLTGLQDIYADNNKNKLPTEDIVELLANMGISVLTDTENSEVKKQDAFTVLRVPSLKNKVNKPCFLKDGKVMLKGVLYEEITGGQ